MINDVIDIIIDRIKYFNGITVRKHVHTDRSCTIKTDKTYIDIYLDSDTISVHVRNRFNIDSFLGINRKLLFNYDAFDIDEFAKTFSELLYDE